MPRNEIVELELKALRVVADRLEQESKTLRATVDSMESAGVTSVEAVYTNSLLRGLRFVDVFIESLSRRFYESQGPTIPDAARRVYRRKGDRK